MKRWAVAIMAAAALRAWWRWMARPRNSDGEDAGDGTVYEDVN